MTRARLLLVGGGDTNRTVGRRTMLALVAAGILFRRQLPSTAAAMMPGIDDETKARLMALVRSQGELVVIVGFAVPGAVPGARQEDGGAAAPPSPGQEERDRAAVARARTRLLTDLGVRADRRGALSGPGIHGVKLFETIPFVALTADSQALERLLANPLVESVQPDTAVPPL